VNSYYTLIAATMVLLLGKLMVSKIKFLRDFNRRVWISKRTCCAYCHGYREQVVAGHVFNNDRCLFNLYQGRPIDLSEIIIRRTVE